MGTELVTITRVAEFSRTNPHYIRDPDRYTRQGVLLEQLQSQINVTSFDAVVQDSRQHSQS
ncbi:MAG: hypothetical protein MK102_12495 [Fuerstiella sp.]|nr:hypothetical protein [Fuerstiella sp.]